ncbi:MAG: helix-turn-helix domain-containing protein [Candidatus Pristimantibacillus sp.]
MLSLFVFHFYENLLKMREFRMKDGEEYRLLRLKKRIRLREVSSSLDCHKTTLSNYENGRYGMSEDKVAKYRDYIDSHKGREKL